MFDDTIQFVWPEMPDQPPLPSLNRRIQQTTSPRHVTIHALTSIHSTNKEVGETLQDLEDERLSIVSEIIRQIAYEDIYAHLPNLYIDWELEGPYVCRVIGKICHGQDFKQESKLKTHLSSSTLVESCSSRSRRSCSSTWSLLSSSL
ncbi:hypothetical protein HDV64DRAFT_235245 [Trichoderma sp. TUCIM 5745]